MSIPSYPVISPPLTRADAINMLLSSVAAEELGLSHILNAEGEKLQFLMGTLPGLTGGNPTLEQILEANESVRSLLETSVQSQVLLNSKMMGALNAPVLPGTPGATGATGAVGPMEGATGPDGDTDPVI